MNDIVLIDAGTGNLRSVQKALENVGATVTRTDDPQAVLSASKVVLPGVGAFGDFMAGLRERKLEGAVKEVVARGVPLLGICVGMQALFNVATVLTPNLPELATLTNKNLETPQQAVEAATALLARVGLADRQDAFPAVLSGGERQRVAVVRALINRPRLLLADEPTGALDAASATALGDLLLKLNRELGTALLVVTHSRELADRMGRSLTLRDGIVQPTDES